MINHSNQWYVDQYNRNRDKKNWINTFAELQKKIQNKLWQLNQK